MYRRAKLRLYLAVAVAVGALVGLTPGTASADTAVTTGLGVSIDASICSNYSGTSLYPTDGTLETATLENTSINSCSSNKAITLGDTTNNYAYVDTQQGSGANPSGDMTVEAWVKFTTINAGWNIIATRWFHGSTADWHFGLYQGKLYLCASDGYCRLIQSTTTITANTWYDLAFTLTNPTTILSSGTCPTNCGTLTYYINGQVDTQSTTTWNYHVLAPTAKLELGDDRTTGSLGLTGLMGKFRIYNRALSPSEMVQNYRNDASTFGVAAVPYPTVNPAISGPALFNAAETTTTGSWRNSPVSYSYQWMRSSTSNGTYVPIAGATSSTYVTVAADVGNYLEVTDTATNGVGAAAATSAPSPLISRAGSTLSISSTYQYPVYRRTDNLTVNTNGATGYVNFTINGKSIAGCKHVVSNSGNGFIAVCAWKPANHATLTVTASFTSQDAGYFSSQTLLGPLTIVPRATTR